ncbi:MAG: N-acetylornithine carbamoyltransferase [Candidatus Daviesbacteria bacterium]|nr:N-acetylornithine carbamoyltransferase [Candidatus Daviesbacteria bacterium]
MKHFLTTSDFGQQELMNMIKTALVMKKSGWKKSLQDRILSMFFFNPSLRTRLSFITAMDKLGGLAVDLSSGSGGFPFEFKENAVMDKNTIEHVKEAVPVISRMSDAIAVRASELVTASSKSVKVLSWDEVKKDTTIQSFAKYATVPVVNMESNVYHPCQGLGDAMTIMEKLGNPKGKKYVLTWVYHPKALPMATANSQILSACDLGMQVTITYPEGWDLDEDIINTAKARARQTGGSLTLANSQQEAFQDAHIVCAKSWGSIRHYGAWSKEDKIKKGLKHWIVDKQKMDLTDNAYFMHCLPVRRNVEVTDEILDSLSSIVIDEAENRMWIQMAILDYLIGKKDKNHG